MRDRLEIGCTPSAEDCEQLGEGYSSHKAALECNAFKRQLYRQFPELVDHPTVRLVIRNNYHDFGTYPEVAVSFDDNDESGIDLAYRIESNMPEYWDDEAKAELGLIAS